MRKNVPKTKEEIIKEVMELNSLREQLIFKKERTRSERKLKEIEEEDENARSCLCVKATGGAGETPLVSLEMKRGPVEVEVSN